MRHVAGLGLPLHAIVSNVAMGKVVRALNLRAGEDPRLRLQAVEHLRVLTALPTP